MTTGHVFIAVSLDGCIARPDGAIDWLTEGWPDDGSDYGYADFMASVDGLVMGRGTFEKALSFPEWPYEKPVVVLSGTLRADDVPVHLRGSVRITDAAPAQLMQELDIEGWKRAYVDGGRLIQSFLREGFVDEMVITRLPILLGAGLPLFGSLPSDVKLAHRSTASFKSGFVQSRYELVR